MNILHGDFRLFGDNQVGNIATMVFAIATRGRSDSGPGDAPAFRHGAKIKSVLRAGADLLTRRIFGLDFDGCRTFGRYLLARASARFSITFVFSPRSAGALRKQPPAMEDESGPVPSPEEGRGRSSSPRIAQDEFPAHISAGVCR
jgi:hypothetical protein